MLIYELQVLDTKTITLYNVIVYKNCWGGIKNGNCCIKS